MISARTQLFNAKPRHRLDAGSYGTMGIGMGFVIAARSASRQADHLGSGDSAIGFSAWRWRRLPLSATGQDRRLQQWRHGSGTREASGQPAPEPEAQRADLRRALRQDDGGLRGKGWFIENPKDLKSALEAAMAFRGPALVNVMISQESARKPQQFRWHS